jgi:hypothetical protein
MDLSCGCLSPEGALALGFDRRVGFHRPQFKLAPLGLPSISLAGWPLSEMYRVVLIDRSNN